MREQVAISDKLGGYTRGAPRGARAKSAIKFEPHPDVVQQDVYRTGLKELSKFRGILGRIGSDQTFFTPRSETPSLHLIAFASLAAVAFLIVVHRAVFAGLFAIRLVRRETHCANRCRQNRKQDFHVILHSCNLARDTMVTLAKKRRQPGRRKHLNIVRFGLIEGGAVKRTRYNVIRFAVVLTTIVAWFSISNHCALGELITKIHSAVAPMHCHGNQPAPSKKTGEEEMPCCKILRATLNGEAKVVEVASKTVLPIQDWVIAELISAAQTQLSPLELDTGPPFTASFAESVLQRSILAHAPPV